MKSSFFVVGACLGSLVCGLAAGQQKTVSKQAGPGVQGLHQSNDADPKLPRVLLIGDSIVNGYRAPVAKALEGKARVDCWITGMHLNSPNLRKHLAEILDQQSYDVIHFNIGLHGWPTGRIPEGQYEPLMRAYVRTLREHGGKAKLIWASTTPVTVRDKPLELDEVIEATVTGRNAIAARVMKESGIPTNDLHGLVVDKLHLARGDKFHWKSEGYALMARAVSEAILQARLPDQTRLPDQGSRPARFPAP